jgi:tRNA(fMet)-specific endonuclease VapC
LIQRLLDTNICIEAIRGKTDRVMSHLRRQAIDSVGISAITLAELQHGVSASKDAGGNLVALVRFCAPLQIMSFDNFAAAAYGDLRATLQRQGRVIGPLDMLIAAHALSMDAILVTNNEREFKRISNLKIENWVKA